MTEFIIRTAAVGLLCTASPVPAQQPDGGPGTFGFHGVPDTGDLRGETIRAPESALNADALRRTALEDRAVLSSARTALLRQTAEIEDAIGMIDVFIEWRSHLLRVALDDPQRARQQRLPMAVCRDFMPAPRCGELTRLFAPDDVEGEAGDASPVNAVGRGATP